MLHSCAEYLTHTLYRHCPLSEEKRPVFVYGFELSLSTLSSILSIILLSIIFKNVYSSLLFLYIFFFLRLFPVDTTLPPIQDASYWQMLFSYLYTFWAKLFCGTSLCLFLLLFYLVSSFFFSLLFEALNIHYRSGSMRKIKKQLELSFRLIFCCF